MPDSDGAGSASPWAGAGEGLRALLPIAVWGACAIVAGYHLALEVRTIGLAEPMGFWEATYASIAREWPNQYQLGHFVLGHDNYGPGFPAFCRPFIALFGDPYVGGRVANLVSLAAAGAIVCSLARRSRCSWAASACAVTVAVALPAGSYSLMVRPDFLLLAEMAGILWLGQAVCQGRAQPARAGLWAGLLALAAYLTKPYGIFGLGAVAAAVAACRGLRPGLVLLGVGGAVVALGVGSYAVANPYYIAETFDAHLAHADPSFPWLLHQAGDFLLLACGPVAAVLSAMVVRRPRPPGRDLRFWGVILAAAGAALLAGPGWHTGAYLTYFIHLALIPLILCGAAALQWGPEGREPLLAPLLFLANASVLMFLAPALPKPDPAWEELARDVRAQAGTVVVDTILEPLSRGLPRVVVADTGMVRYAIDEARSLPGARGADARREADAFGSAWKARLGQHPPAAFYLDFLAVVDPSVPGGHRYRLRNGLPWLSDQVLGHYVPERSFHIRPYYAATNERRQDAGQWEALIVKLVPSRR